MEESTSREIQLVIASKNNEDQTTQKEANISGGNENTNDDELVIEIREMFRRPEIQSSTQRLIHKVPHYLRKCNEEAYTPQVISIGPIHHENERLKAMQKHKERYFRSFMIRSEMKLEHLLDTIRKMEGRIRGYYAVTFDLTSNMFVKMILVDASFILELFSRCSSEIQTMDDPIFLQARPRAIMLDLLLLENQLPFFVIEELHQLAFPSPSDADPCLTNYHVLVKLSLKYFSDSFFLSEYFSDSNIDQFIKAHPNVKIEHFTDLFRTFQLPPPEKLPRRSYQHIGLLYTATQLHKAGVKFEVGRSDSECCFDIELRGGVLKIPRLELTDLMGVVTQNIMALEQTHYIEAAYFTDYFILMGLLIDTREDVDLLCHKKILFNFLGDNNAAKSMIKNFNNGIKWTNMRNDYIDLSQHLNVFCEHAWPITRRQFYVTSASIVTVLTVIQTICSIIQLSE